MIKCPFCAEDIQSDAIKCKHCGEWIQKAFDPASPKYKASQIKLKQPNHMRCDNCGVEYSSEYFTKNETICNECSEKIKTFEKGIGGAISDPTKPQQSDEADDEIYYKSPLKSKSRWGWGWFILLLSYSSWYNKAAVKPNAISGILAPVVMFVCYFWLRTRMIGIFSKLWKVSFVAGVVSLFVSSFLLAILTIIGI